MCATGVTQDTKRVATLALVTCIEGWRYWDCELLRLLSDAPLDVFLEDQDDGKRTTTEKRSGTS